jgi:hypothetical protein
VFASPVYLLGTTLATLMAATFQLFLGRTLSQALLYWFSGVIGFFLGHAIGLLLLPSWPVLGQIYIVSALIVSFGAMFLVKHLKLC